MKQVDQLAGLYGIPGEYTDAAGQTVSIPDEYRLTALAAMNIPVNTEKQRERAIARQQLQQWEQLLPPVRILHQGQPCHLVMQVPSSRLNNTFRGELVLESGKVKSLAIRAGSLPEIERATFSDKEFVRLKLVLPDELPRRLSPNTSEKPGAGSGMPADHGAGNLL